MYYACITIFCSFTSLKQERKNMPIVKSKYEAPLVFRSYHLSTIYAATLREAPVQQERERLELPDSDFLDIDWSFSKTGKTKKVLIVIHGLEGSAQRPYVTVLRHILLKKVGTWLQ